MLESFEHLTSRLVIQGERDAVRATLNKANETLCEKKQTVSQIYRLRRGAHDVCFAGAFSLQPFIISSSVILLVKIAQGRNRHEIK